MAGAEVNALLTATELKNRGHSVAILHGPGTGKGEDPLAQKLFPRAFPWQTIRFRRCWRNFRPDVIYVHKMADPVRVGSAG